MSLPEKIGMKVCAMKKIDMKVCAMKKIFKPMNR